MNIHNLAANIRRRTEEPGFACRLWLIIEAALEYLISIMVSGAYLARITSSLGFSDSLTGILASFVSLGCLFQLVAIVLFSKMRSAKRPVICCHIINELLFMLVYLTPVMNLASWQKTTIFLVCFCSANILSKLMQANKTDWMTSLIDIRSLGKFTANKEIVSLISGMTFTYIMGNLIDHMEASGNTRTAFIFGAVTIFVLSVAHISSVVRVPEKAGSARGSIGIRDSLRRLLADKMVRRVVLACVIWHIATSCAYPFYGAYQINELGFSMTFVSLLSILYSIVRVTFSPMLGRYADRRSFSHMSCTCFMIAAAGFLVNCFTTPENGKVLYTLFFCLYAVAMGGINSSLTNLIFENVKGDNRRDALAINAALGGVAGFGATCLMSPVVAYIQSNGNMIFGIHIYAAQFASIIAFVLTSALVIYMRLVVIGRKTA